MTDADHATAMPPAPGDALAHVDRDASPTDVGRRPTQRPRAATAAIILYAVGAFIANWPAWPGDPNLFRQGDLTFMVWGLSWTPHAILHGQNIFQSNWLNYPYGINLAQNTTMPLLGILTAPLTLAVSPVASLNLLLWLALVLSPTSMYFVLRACGMRPLAAFVGGALYGFSPYMAGQGLDHLVINFVPLPPLIFLCAYRLFVQRDRRPLRWGLALGALAVAQFFISAEICITTLLTTGIALVVLAVARPRGVPTALRHGLKGLLLAVALFGTAIAYPFWVVTFGLEHATGRSLGGGLSSDLLSPVFPTSLQRFAPASMLSIGNKLVLGDFPENGGYLGIPLLIALAWIVIRHWRDRWIRFSFVMMVVMFILSLGPYLTIDGHATVYLPGYLFYELPLLKNVAEVRLSLYVACFAAIILARWIDISLKGAPISLSTLSDGFPVAWQDHRSWLRVVPGGVLAIASVLALIPSWPYPNGAIAVPAYFTSTAVQRIPVGSVVLLSPYPSVAEVQPQLWQAIARMRFRIIGGYGIYVAPGGGSDPYPAVLQPSDVETYLWTNATDSPPYPDSVLPADNARLAADLRTFLKRYDVGTIVYTPNATHPQEIFDLFRNALGPPTAISGSVAIWYQVQRLLATARS